jgi:hypothetical protein
VTQEPPAPVTAAEAPPPTEAPGESRTASTPEPPPAAPAASASPAQDPAPICEHARCNAEALHACGGTNGTQLALVDELSQCAREAASKQTRDYYRRAAFEHAFRDGALLPGAGDRLVRGRVIGKDQAKALADLAAQVPRVLAGQKPPYRSLDPRSCALDAAEGGVELVCWARGDCVGACLRQHFTVRIRVEPGGLRLGSAAEKRTDDGSCGCCG